MSDQNPRPTRAEAEAKYNPPLPAAVQRQLAEAEAIRAGAPPPPSQQGDSAQIPAMPVAPPQPTNPSSAPLALAPVSPQPQPVAPQPAPPPPAPAEEGDARYKSLLGRYTAQQERLSELERQMATLAMRPTEAPLPAPAPRPRELSDQEVTDYGEEMLSVVGKRAREEFMPELDTLGARLKRLEGRIDATTSIIDQTQVKDVYSSLNGTVPNWKDINRSQQFKDWLAQPDTLSGRQRMDMLQDAFARHEGNRVLAFFQGFLSEAAGPPVMSPGPGNATTPVGHPGNGHDAGNGRPTLEDFAAPGRARSAPQPMPPDKPVYSQAWIAKFSDEKRRGLYRGREAEVETIERDIFRAQHEGRIQ